MKDKTKGEPLSLKTYKAVLKHIKNKNMFRHINKAGALFKQAMYVYMSHFMNNELVPDTYDYTKLFGLWKGKGSKLDLNMTSYCSKQLMCTAGKNYLYKTIHLFQVAKRLKFHDGARGARG